MGSGGWGGVTLEGGGGDDILMNWAGFRNWNEATPETLFSYDHNMGATPDLMLGGGGDDLIMTGYGSDTVNGGDGNDVIWVEGTGKYTWSDEDDEFIFDQNVLTGGAGSDTFIVSTFAQQMLSYEFDPGGFRSYHEATDWTEETRDWGLQIGSYVPVIGDLVDFVGFSAKKISGYTTPTYGGSGWTPPSLTIDIPAPEKSQIITDFNPLEDVLIVDLVPENDTRLSFEAKDPQQGYGFFVSQRNIATPLLDVTLNLDEVKEQLGNAYGSLSDRDLSEALLNSIQRSYLYLDGANDSVATGAQLDNAVSTDLGWLGHNQMASFGAVGAPLLEMGGLVNINHLTGTNGAELIAGFSTESWRPESPLNHDVSLYGFGGDDILMGGGGNNQLHGGDGNDTAFYNTDLAGNRRAFGITVDMADTTTVSWGNGNSGTYFTVDHGTVADITNAQAFTDQLFDIENITGSMFDDVIRGDDNDNILTSGEGDDILAGRGGADTFVLSGGSNTIEDASGEDSVEILADAYSFSGSQPAFLISEIDRNGDRTITSSGGDLVATLNDQETSSFDPITGIRVIDADGNSLDADLTFDVPVDPPIDPELPGTDPLPGDPITGTDGNDILMGTDAADTFHWSAGNDLVKGFSFEHGDLFHITADTSYAIVQSGSDAQLVTDFGTTTFVGVSADQLVAEQSVVIV
ncbi:calcium-binding protein [Synechococcus sp. RSCCF101]|uniref:calcium-binding protein n=1 Tax=Synechococcus sp. RSCCF101 TaxID=2511069 RepID=UPI001244EC07|nr:calcium-binding protein [Synechococcus sp. RSCCF101]QEY31112.1 calcium-binding protein [Synechococcus sp. RSCCF101]